MYIIKISTNGLGQAEQNVENIVFAISMDSVVMDIAIGITSVHGDSFLIQCPWRHFSELKSVHGATKCPWSQQCK